MSGPLSAAVVAKGVERRFRSGLTWRRQAPALSDVDFSVAQGSTVGLIGPNGSGKSTLLRLVAGVDRPTSGAIQVLGRGPGHPETQKRLAFLPDGQPFPPELSARQALHLIAALKGLPRAERRKSVPAMLERVGLGDRQGTKLGAFSRGMHRRFGLGQAFITRPELVLLDEPTAGLDAPGFDVLSDVLGEARERGTTVVLASHVASDLVDHCDQLVLLRGGRVLRVGTPDDLLAASNELEVRVAMAAEGADAQALAAGLDRAAREAGGEVTHVQPARRSLLDLYSSLGGPGDRRDP